MGDDSPKLSQQELALVLQRAAERESREGPRSFSPEEVVQAGRELGLAPGTVEAELQALVARKRPGVGNAVGRERPFDTRVTLESSPDRFVLRVPPRGLHAAAVVKLGFSVFWLGFVGFWTRSTFTAVSAGASPFFALFSIPFWLVGVGLLGTAIRSIIGGERLELDRESGTLSRSPGGMKKKVRTRELRVRQDRLRRRQGDSQDAPVVLLEHGTRSFTLLEGFSEAEQRWVTAELEAWLDR